MLKLLVRKADLEAEAEKLEDDVVRLAAAAADSREYVSAKARLENVRLKIETVVRQLDPSQAIGLINEAIDKAKAQHVTAVAAERSAFEERMRTVARERRRLLDVPLKHPADFNLLLEKTGNPFVRQEAGLGDSDPMGLYLEWHRDDHIPATPWKLVRDLPKTVKALWSQLEAVERERSPLLTIKERRMTAMQGALASGVNVFADDSCLGHLRARVVVCPFMPPVAVASGSVSRATSLQSPGASTAPARSRGPRDGLNEPSDGGVTGRTQLTQWRESHASLTDQFSTRQHDSGGGDSTADEQDGGGRSSIEGGAPGMAEASDSQAATRAAGDGLQLFSLQPARGSPAASPGSNNTARAVAQATGAIGRAIVSAEGDEVATPSQSQAAPPLVLPGVQHASAAAAAPSSLLASSLLGSPTASAAFGNSVDLGASRASSSGASPRGGASTLLSPSELSHRTVLAGAAYSSFVRSAPMADILRTTRSLARAGLTMDTHSQLDVPDALSASMTADQRKQPLHPSYLMKTDIEHEKRFEPRVKGNKEGTFSEPDPMTARTTSERRLAAKLLIMDRTSYNPLKDGKSVWTTKNTDLTGGALGFGRYPSDGEFLRDSDNAKAAAIEARFWSQAGDGGAGAARMSPATLLRSPRSRAKSPRKSPGQRSRGKASAGRGGGSGAALLAQGSRESL